MKRMDPRRALADRVKVAGNQRKLAEELDLSEVYISDLLRGRRPFSDAVLRKLGLESVVVQRTA